MGSNKDLVLIKDGKRLDGRKADELRPMSMELGVLNRADGSCYLEWGRNKVMAAVYGPRECLPKHTQNPLKARVTYRYTMVPFSTEDRCRPGPNRRSTEISKVSRDAFEKVIFTEYFPKTSIDIYVDVLQADAGSRCAAMTAASLALADAGIPMKAILASCAAGKVNDQVIVDLDKAEDNFGQADVPITIIPRTKEIVFLQMDGDLTKEEFKTAIELSIKGCEQIYEKQKEALKNAYKGEINGSK